MKNEHEYQRNLSILDLAGIDYKLFNNYQQANFKFSCGTVAFYPGTNKWVFLGISYKGNASALVFWMTKKDMNREDPKSPGYEFLNEFNEENPFG